MNDVKRNGSTGGGGGGAEASREVVSAGRVWYNLRAYLDTLCESERATDRSAGPDRAAILRRFADAVDGSMVVLGHAAVLARAEAIALDADRYPPVPDEESTTEIRRKANAREDSQPGRKRS